MHEKATSFHPRPSKARSDRTIRSTAPRGVGTPYRGVPRTLRVRRAHCVPSGPTRRGAPRNRRAGPGGDAYLCEPGGTGGRARRGDGSVRRRPAAGRRGPAEPREVQPNPGGGHRQPDGSRTARSAQPCNLRARVTARALLCAGPLFPDRMQHRGQRGGERGWAALPEIRPDRAQHPGTHRDHRRRRTRHHRRWCARQPRVRLARVDDGLGRSARSGGRSQGEAASQAGLREGSARGVCRCRERRRRGRRDHRRREYFPPAWR